MRSPIACKWCPLPIAFLSQASSVAGAQARVEQGREVLNGVRAVHLMIDFGGEALEPGHIDPFELAMKLSRQEEEAELGSDEWDCRRRMLDVERLGRDMIAGKAIPEASAKIVDEHFKLIKDPITGWRWNEEAARLSDEGNRRYRKLLQQLAGKLAAGTALSDHDFAMVRYQHRAFRSGDQLNWGVPDLSFDVPGIAKAYPSAGPKDQHAMRILLGLRGKADDQAVAFTLNALGGNTPIERYDAAFAAGRMHPPSHRLISALANCLDDPDPRVARAAVRSLLALNATQSAPAMLRRLRRAAGDEDGAALDERLGFGFEGYDIWDSHIGFRHDLPTELMFALGRLRHRGAVPLLWEIVQGNGSDVWEYEGIYELGHGGVAFEAIVAVGSDDPAAAARRALAMNSATVDALRAAANVLGEYGQPADVPVLIGVMSRLDTAARIVPRLHFQTDRTMSRVTFAAERLLFFADPDEPRLPEIRQALVAEMRKCATGPFGEPIIAALEHFDPDRVEVTALALVADTKAEPDARRIATEILGRAKNLQHVEPLIALFEDEGNATNGPVGLHAAWAVSKILAAADRADPRVAALVERAADKLERIKPASPWWPMKFLRVLIRIDSDRGVKKCSSLALDGSADDLERSIALDYIARDAEPNRDLAMPLRPLLDVSLTDPRATARLRAAAARAMAKLLGLEHDQSGASGRASVEERVRRELEKAPRVK